MKVLLDTHVLIWSSLDSPRLGARMRDLLDDPATEVSLSVASVWEIAIKAAAGRLRVKEPPRTWVPREIARLDCRVLGIELAHALAVYDLPQHHRDPFDRMLVAQARIESLTIVTVDPEIPPYGVATIDASQ